MVVSYLTILSDVLITGIFVGESAIAAVNMLVPIVGVLYFVSGMQFFAAKQYFRFNR